MAEHEPQSIVSEIVEKRKSIAEAKTQLPSFVSRLDALILNHVALEERNISWYDYKLNTFGSVYDDAVVDKLHTKLNAKIATDVGPIEVNIASKYYPGENAEQAEYRISVQDLDHYLVIKNGDWNLESKSREQDNSEGIVIGGHYHTWPTWTREVGMETVGRYNGLLDVLESGAYAEFSGSTPPKLNLDPATTPKISFKNLPSR